MSVEFFHRIAFRLARNVVLVALLLGLLGAIGQVSIDLRHHLRAMHHQIDEVFFVSRNAAQRAVYLLDNSLAEEVVSGLRNHTFLHHIQLRDDRENIMAEFSRPLITSSKATAATQVILGSATTEYDFDLISSDGRLEGFLTLTVDNNAALTPFYGRVLYVLVSGLASNILLALILLTLFNRLLTSPLSTIAHRIGDVDGRHPNGDCIDYPPGHHNDELGFIVDSTNTFIREVSETQRALRESEHQLRVVVDASPNLVFVLNRRHEIVFANARTVEFYGRTEDELLGQNYIELQRALSPLQADRVSAELATVLHHNGRVSHDNMSLTDQYHVPRVVQMTYIPFQFCGETCALSIAGDITDRVSAEAHVERLAYYDTLTGLPNRNLVHDRVSMDIARAERNGLYGALLFLDIDDFKRINDTMGHPMGDQVLVHLTERMKTQMRRSDTLARIGGDEFVISLPDLSPDAAEAEQKIHHLLETLLQRISQPITIGTHEFRMSASIGVVLYTGSTDTAETLLRHADTAMYEAKRKGKNRHQLFHPSMATEVSRLVQLEQDLQLALQEHQFEVFLQPIIHHLTGKYASAEALLRWNHPTRGLLSPVHFMPFLENSNMINEVGLWVLETVCQYLSTELSGRDLPDDIRISVNISARELYQPNFVISVQNILERYQLSGKRLEFEVTEGVALQSITDAVAIMQELKSLGITFALDDFGTGYSSLSYLKQLPVDTVKIDKSFINGITEDAQDAELVACIMAIANTLKLKTVAEGVELQDQATWLTRYQGVCVQGYLYSHPLPISQFHADWLVHNDTPKS